MTDVRVDNPADFPPQEDTVERLWTPQRMTYVLRNSEDRPTKPKTKECPFCAGPKKSDEDGLIAWRGTHVFAIMNLYPYNVGHLMICPYRHVGFITELDDAELFEFEKATTLAMKVMETVSRPDGYNIGINQGEVAGAGVAAHLHQELGRGADESVDRVPVARPERGAQAQHSTLRAAPKARIKALTDNGSDPCAGQRNRHSR